MKKNLLIAILCLLLGIVCIGYKNMANRAAYHLHQEKELAARDSSYWKSRCIAAEKLLHIVDEYDEDFYMDVLMETDIYIDWSELSGNN
jgi:hypothetical protein